MIKQFFVANGLRILVVAGLAILAVVFYLYAALQFAEGRNKVLSTQLEVATQTIEAQQRAIEAVDRVADLERRLDNIVTNSVREILEAEGANEQVPPAVADAWAAGIDGLRNESGSDSGEPKIVPGPGETKRAGSDSGPASGVLTGAGKGASAVPTAVKGSI